MNAGTLKKNTQKGMQHGDGRAMRGPVLASAFFHVVIVVLSIVGLPYVVKDHPLVDNSIAVEIVEIDKITQTDRAPAPKAKPVEDKPKTQPREIPPEADKPKAPTVTAKEPPKPVAPEKPKADDVAPPRKEEQPQEKKAEDKPAPPKPKARPATPPAPSAKTEEKVQEQEQFDSLLRNLMKSEPQSVAEESEGQGQQTAPQATLSNRMTMSEMDAVRFQLGQCWKLLAGARYAEDLVVEIRLTINPDRTVRDARILEQMRYNSDPYFRAAADSAYRAVFETACNPLMLPPDKYDQWKNMTVRFDPRDML